MKQLSKYAVIDLGSNTIRLVIFEVERHTHHAKSQLKYGSEHNGKTIHIPKFTTIVNEKKAVGLSQYVKNGTLTKAGIECAEDVLIPFINNAKGVKCKKIAIFATAVIRNASNCEDITKTLEKNTGVAIDVLSGKEEAHLGFVGVSAKTPIDHGLLVDIGGGSTELTYIKDSKDVLNESIPVGCVSLYAKNVSMIFPNTDEQASIVETIKPLILDSRIMRSLPKDEFIGSLPFYCMGGSSRAAAKMAAKMKDEDRSAKSVSIEEITAVLALLHDNPSTFAHTAVKAEPDRLHSLIPGTLILQTCMQAIGADVATVCKYGVREGYLIEKMLD